jgi:hypothetical protein
LNDGTAVAISPAAIDPRQAHLIIGRAWGASEDPSVKLVNAVVGLPGATDLTPALLELLSNQNDRIESLEARLERLEATLSEK